ncbi:MAG: hypothetical protein MJZ55_00265 [Paludibacteraceae bacterium]|nr:hypothetical protein [Paludibacteraceae bacterium]
MAAYDADGNLFSFAETANTDLIIRYEPLNAPEGVKVYWTVEGVEVMATPSRYSSYFVPLPEKKRILAIADGEQFLIYHNFGKLEPADFTLYRNGVEFGEDFNPVLANRLTNQIYVAYYTRTADMKTGDVFAWHLPNGEAVAATYIRTVY